MPARPKHEMDDCSACHVHGYIAPRAKSFAVAKDGNAPTANPVKWILPWKTYAAAFGPQWKLGKAPTNFKWVSGQGAAPLTTDASCGIRPAVAMAQSGSSLSTASIARRYSRKRSIPMAA